MVNSGPLQRLRSLFAADNTSEQELITNHYREIQSIYREMRDWRHDYHNHLQTLKGHMALGQLAELEEYLNALEQDLDAVDPFIKSGNTMLDALLNSKVTLAKERQIPCDVTANAAENLSVSDIDLCVILGNLIDNAIESNLQIENSGERFLRIYIGSFKGQFYISVSNAVAGTLQRDSSGLFPSTKISRRGGQGLRRIDNTVTRNQGYVNRQHEPGVFATEVFLPM